MNVRLLTYRVAALHCVHELKRTLELLNGVCFV